MTDLFHTNCPHCGQRMPEQRSARFEQFWQQVPAKVAKAQAKKIFDRLSSQERQVATERCKSFYARWRKDHPDASWLHPSTYLSQRRWEDYADEGQTKADPELIQRMLNSTSPAVREAAKKMMAKADE